MDTLSIIASTIAILQAIASTYKAIQHLRGLPKAFDEVNRSLPLVEDSLVVARDRIRDVDLDESTRRAIEPVISSCQEKAKALLEIFQRVDKAKKDANGSALDTYRARMLRLGKGHRVENLMQDILRGLQALAINQSLRAATHAQVARLERAISVLSQRRDRETRRIAILQALHASPYRDRKDRNPKRVPGTCEWFVNHDLFRQWRESNSSSMLWVSADPGCGKSVLAKYLVEEKLRTTESRTTCYFFFKDDFEDQKSAKSALCCILHQLFTQREVLFSDEILKGFEAHESHLTGSFGDLWNVLVTVSEDKNAGEIVCILDAFDECDQERSKLAEALCDFYRTRNAFNLKFLVTSRPHGTIRRDFQPLDIPGLPVVHLSGESDDEMRKIAQEIDIYINARVQDIRAILKLSPGEEKQLLEGLLGVANRTYLWAHLTLDLVQGDINIDKTRIHQIVSCLPPTVDDAYERILNKSNDPEKARKLLHIVVSATRPLTLAEMAVAFTLQQIHKSYKDLNLSPEERFGEYVRDLCGLFVTIISSKIYLLHQTAREFLVQDGGSKEPSSERHNSLLKWKFSLQPQESHRILYQICVWHLLFTEFETHPLDENKDLSQYLHDHVFLDYSTKNWALHFRMSGIDGHAIIDSLLAICDAKSNRCLTWFRIYWSTTQMDFPQEFTTLMIASYFGLEPVVKLLFKGVNVDVNSIDSTHCRSALSWASESGFDGIVKLLIQGPRFRFRHLKSSFWKSTVKPPFWTDTNIDVGDRYRRTPLSYAAWNGHIAVVKRLVKAGARVDSEDDIGGTPISYALCSGHEAIANQLMKGAPADSVDLISRRLLFSAIAKSHKAVVERLLEKGVNTEVVDTDGWTPLYIAARNGDEAIVRLLLGKGANTEVVDTDGWTPLYIAAMKGDEAIVRLLLGKGANTEVVDTNDWTPLFTVTRNGDEAIVRLLLEKGANTEVVDTSGRTPLYIAAMKGAEAIVWLLLEKGANTEVVDTSGRTPLCIAACNRHEATVRLLLEKGANTEVVDKDGQTLLCIAARNRYEVILRLLLENGANTEAVNRYGRTPLHYAAWDGHEAIIRLLLEKGANIEVVNMHGQTPLYIAACKGHEAIVQLLLENGANIEAVNTYGQTPLHIAAWDGYETIVQLLLEKGANIELLDRLIAQTLSDFANTDGPATCTAAFTTPALATKPRVPRTRSTQDIIDNSSPVSDHNNSPSRSPDTHNALPEPIEFGSPIAPQSSPSEELETSRSSKRRRISIASSAPNTETNPELAAIASSQAQDSDLKSLPDALSSDGDDHIASYHSEELGEDNELEEHDNQPITVSSSFSSSSSASANSPLPTIGSELPSQQPALSDFEQAQATDITDVTKPNTINNNINNKPAFHPAPRFKHPGHTHPNSHPDHEDSGGYLPDIFSPRRRGEKYLAGGPAAELRDWLVEVKSGVDGEDGQQLKAPVSGSAGGGARVVVEQVRRGMPGMTMVSGSEVNGDDDNGAGGDGEKKGAGVRVILAGEGIVQGLGGGAGANRRRVVPGAVVAVAPPAWEVELDGEGRWAVAYRWEVCE
ncbi:hypothetical protein MFIFM68171_05353 [Madurella fahalii]|uniref:Ankyrin repeat protein n=1 Tax=Madurella fahalii TaxID=1157608 RepID=A0ABQ0GBM5_9PEZI